MRRSRKAASRTGLLAGQDGPDDGLSADSAQTADRVMPLQVLLGQRPLHVLHTTLRFFHVPGPAAATPCAGGGSIPAAESNSAADRKCASGATPDIPARGSFRPGKFLVPRASTRFTSKPW